MSSENNNSIATPTVIEYDSPGKAIRSVVTGLSYAAVVRKYMDPEQADKQAELIINHCDWRARKELGGTLGPSLFEYSGDPIDYFLESQSAAMRIQNALGKQPEELYNAIKLFESLLPRGDDPNSRTRIKPVVYRGIPAAYNRALIFDCSKPNIVSIHEDLSNVRALAKYNLETSESTMVMAHNLYLRNKKGQGSLVIYGKRFTEDEKIELDKKIGSDENGNPSKIATTGYPYPESVFDDCPSTRIDVDAGDYLVFRADYPHKVVSFGQPTEGYRVSWNGFFTPLYNNTNELVYWT